MSVGKCILQTTKTEHYNYTADKRSEPSGVPGMIGKMLKRPEITPVF